MRSTRERLGEPLESVASALRIRPGYLEDIEAGRFESLPNGAYAVGFIRAYADHLGLHSEEVVRRFRNENQKVAPSTSRSLPAPPSDGPMPRGVLILSALVLAACAYGGWYWMSMSERTVSERVPDLPERLKPLVDDTDGAAGGAGAPGVLGAGAPGDAVSPVAEALAFDAADGTHGAGQDAALEGGASGTSEPAQDGVGWSSEAGTADDVTAADETGGGGLPSDGTPADALPSGARDVSPEADGDGAPAVGPDTSAGSGSDAGSVRAGAATIGAANIGAANGGAGSIGGGSRSATQPNATSAPVSGPSATDGSPAQAAGALAGAISGAPVVRAEGSTGSRAGSGASSDRPAAAPVSSSAPSSSSLSSSAAAPAAAVEPPSARAGSDPVRSRAEAPSAPVAAPASAASPGAGALAASSASAPSASAPAADARPAAPDPSPAATAGAPETAAPLAGAPETAAPQGGVDATASAAPPAEPRIVLRASRDSWIELRRDSVLLTRKFMRTGDVYIVPEGDSLTLSASNSGGLEVYVDGLRVPALGPPGVAREAIPMIPDRLRRLQP
nr:RodZ domain-containing protein [Phaeovibrio sulfidiphilus]